MKNKLLLLLVGLLLVCCLPAHCQMKAKASQGQVLLSFTPGQAPANAPVTALRVYRGQALGTEKPITAPVLVANAPCPATFPAGNECYIDTSFVSGVWYYYQVTNINANGEGPRSNELWVNTIPIIPNPPTNAAAIVLKTNPAVLLTWTLSTTTGEVYYNVYRDISGTSNYVKQNPSPLVCTSNPCSYYDDLVLNGTWYNYEVTTWQPGNGESAFSNKVFAPWIP
jgi:hypothetical protein